MRVFRGPGHVGRVVRVALDGEPAAADGALGPRPPPGGVWRLRAPAPLPLEAALAAAARLRDERGARLPLALDAGGRRLVVEAEGDDLWARVPRATPLNFVQPAFAARALSLSPLELEGRHLAQGMDAGPTVLLVPVQDADALARARFAPERLRDLVLRVRFDAVLAFARDGPARLRARLFGDAVVAEGAAAAALAPWLAEERFLGGDAVDAALDAGDALVRVRAAGGAAEARVGGRVVP